MKVSIAESRFDVDPIGNTCLVIDVLRATSVMAVLLEQGVKEIYLADSIESARDLKASLLLPEEVLMIGERNSLPPDDFDGGNSPLAFLRLSKKKQLPSAVIMATTNGTPTLLSCVGAELIMPIAPVNLDATVQRAIREQNDIVIVCSGWEGAPAEDDFLAAALVIDVLEASGAILSESASDLKSRYKSQYENPISLSAALAKTEHGQRLLKNNFEEDIEYCAQINLINVTGHLKTDINGLSLIVSD